ncbi:MAG TPA: putative quinol monooxygenase [Saliniramus sp.]|nr:putative quinol monooxygenase [Saliniramus sp.]
MKPYVILVEFDVFPGMETRFEECILENAQSSKDDEPGCRVFDVLQRPDSEFAYVLYEIYDDHAAFDAHLRSAHFASFDAAVKPMVRGKRVTELRLLSPAPT